MVVVMLSMVVASQAATIKGKIVDKATKEPLFGATVFVVETNQGATTDFDGNFELKLSRGEATLEFSYIAYLTQTMSIEVNAKTPELVIELEEDAQTISEVVVTARKNLESEATLQNERIASNVAIENMGAKEMSIKGISNVQEGVKKITGISVASSGQLVVRGLGDRYSVTTLNGQPIASPNPDNKLIPLDIFPSSTVKNITVSKVYNAASYADYSGAHVDIATKDLSSDDFVSFGFKVGGNTNTTFQDFYRMDNVSLFTQSKVSQTVVDDILAGGDINSYISSNGFPFDTSFNVNKTNALPVFGGNAAWGHGYEVGNQKLSILLSGGISNDRQTDSDSEYRLYEATGGVTDEYVGTSYESSLKIATLGNIGMTLRDNDRIGYTFFYARNASDEYSYRRGTDYEDGLDMVFSNSVTHIYKLATHQLNGVHELGDAWSVNWSGAYTTTSADEPDRRQVAYSENSEGMLKVFTDKTNSTMRYYGTLNEDEYNANLSSTYKFGDAHKITFGAAYKDKVRDYVGRRYYYTFSQKYDAVSQYIYSDPYSADSYLTVDNLKEGVFSISPSYQAKDCYDAASTIASAYASLDLGFADAWLINAGLRYEKAEQTVNYSTGSASDSRTYKTDDLFPALNVRYSFDEKNQFRVAASRTVTRPSFIEMAPFQYQESYGSAQIVGNADVENGYNYNLDLRYETFFEGGDMFSVTGYYKYLDSPIERVQTISGGGELHTFYNADQGLAAGVEIEARKTISQDLRFNVNGSYMYTNVALSEDASYTNPNRELQGASPYLLNADLTYTPYLDDEGRSMSIALLYNLQGPRIHAVGTANRGDVYQMTVHSLNFNVAYSITKNIQVSAQLSNLLNRDDIYKQEIAGENVIVESHNYGIGGEVGVSFKF
ncbi:MAG: TonB-dependent receptor [Rikenellaceae bacterium]